VHHQREELGKTVDEKKKQGRTERVFADLAQDRATRKERGLRSNGNERPRERSASLGEASSTKRRRLRRSQD